jgi:hypothetical protein
MKNIILFAVLFHIIDMNGVNKVSNKNGNWSDPTAWTPNGVPTSVDNVTISAGNVISINVSASCNNIVIGNGFTAATLRFSGSTNRLFSVHSVTVSGLSTFNIQNNATHTLVVSGDIVNNGSFNMRVNANRVCKVTFTGLTNQLVSGTGGQTQFYTITVNAASASNIVEINSTVFNAPSGFLTLVNGIFRFSVPGVAVTPASSAFSIPVSAGLWISAPGSTVNLNNQVSLSGLLRISGGILKVGSASGHNLTSLGGTVSVESGTVNIAGCYCSSLTASTYSMTGGVVALPTIGTSSGVLSPFHSSSVGSSFYQSGGTIIIIREGCNGTQHQGYTNTGALLSSVTGGTLQLGNGTSPAAQTVHINSSVPIPGIVLNSGNVTGVFISSATVNGDVEFNGGKLQSDYQLLVGGNWVGTGTYVPGTGTVNFNSSGTQTVSKAAGEIFNHVNFTGGTTVLGAAITANGNFSIAPGATVNASVNTTTITVKRHFIQNGGFVPGEGAMVMNGVSTQSIMGGSVSFHDLEINNSAGVVLSATAGISGALQLNNGTFNVTGQEFTLISDVNGTARIAPISGSADLTGDVNIQRYSPGGSTGWIQMGVPLSSSLTISQWDDDTYITCPGCPDGFSPGFYSAYYYDETAGGMQDDGASFIPVTSVNNPIQPFLGYWLYTGTGQYTTAPVTFDVKGTIRKFNTAIPINYTNHGLPAEDGWNLISNPYPSPVSWSALKGSTQGIDNAVYVYNADLNNGTGGYATFINGISSPAVSAGGIGDELAMCQAFYVHSTGATSLLAQESNKVATGVTFHKNAATATRPMLRLNLRSANQPFDEALIYFQAGATNGFDAGYDSYKLKGSDPAISSVALEQSNVLFQVNGVAPLNGTYTTSVKVLTGVAGTHTLGASGFESFRMGTCLSLYDRFTSSTIDLKAGDYVFTLSDTTTVARFILTVTLQHLNVATAVTQPMCENPQGGELIASPAGTGPWNFFWRQNGLPVKTSLNRQMGDTLSAISSGSIDLEIYTGGGCDFFESSFNFAGKTPVSVSFTCADTVYMAAGGYIAFSDNCVNALTKYWDFGTGSGIAEMIYPSYIYSAPGDYVVTLLGVSSTGCTDTVSKTIHVIADYTGLQTRSIQGYLVKNTALNEYLIAIPEGVTPGNAKLYDVQGRLMKDLPVVPGKDLPLDMNNYAPGIYVLKFTGGQPFTTRLPVR